MNKKLTLLMTSLKPIDSTLRIKMYLSSILLVTSAILSTPLYSIK